MGSLVVKEVSGFFSADTVKLKFFLFRNKVKRYFFMKGNVLQ